MSSADKPASGAPVSLAGILAALDKVQAAPLPRVRVRAKPGELTLLRALADALRGELDSGTGKHRLTQVKPRV